MNIWIKALGFVLGLLIGIVLIAMLPETMRDVVCVLLLVSVLVDTVKIIFDLWEK